MSFIVVIPARHASTRLPGKPLLDIAGKSMIERVYCCAKSSKAERVIVATDHKEIANCVTAFGGEVCLTRSDHPSGTDRLHEVAQHYSFSDETIIVNVQGDEPLIPAQVINQVAENLNNAADASVATLSEAITKAEDAFNPNVVKVVSDINSMALYFSRATIPWDRENFTISGVPNLSSAELAPLQRHIGIYAYRVGLLNQFVSWLPASLEKIERLEQLRILANGHRIHIETACAAVPAGIDTEADLTRVRELFSG